MQIILPPTDFPRTVLYVKFRIFDENHLEQEIANKPMYQQVKDENTCL